MFQNLFCVLIIFSFFGCAATSKDIGGYHNNMATGLEVQYRYSYTSISKDEDGKLVTSEKSFTIQNENLPSNIVKVTLGMLVINPYKQDFEIWENLQFKSLKKNKVYLKHKKLRYKSQLLPEELVFFNLPLVLEEHTQVIFSVDVLTTRGELVYSTNSAEYKIGSNNN